MDQGTQTRSQQRGEAGASFLELLIVFFLFAIIGIMTYDLLVGTAQTNLYLESNNDLSEFGQRLVNEIKSEMLQSKRLMDNTTVGAGYLAALELSSAPEPIDSTVLPTIELNGSFSPSMASDPDLPFVAASVGNAILFAEAMTPYIDDTNDVRIDTYRFVFYYLAKNTGARFQERDHFLDLYRWESVQYADYSQLRALLNRDDEGATLSSALSALQTEDAATGRPAITVAWDPGEEVDAAFYDFEGSSSLPESPDSTHEPNMASVSSALPRLSGPRIGGKMEYTVAFNSSESFDIGDAVPQFATADTSGDGFPNGFEVMMAGPTGGRKVFIRLVLAADSGHARLVSRENVVLVNARDY